MSDIDSFASIAPSVQETVSPEQYEVGSPHLKHSALTRQVVAQLRTLVLDQLDRKGRCRVLEVGGGSGIFTDHMLAAGAEVVITEASSQSATQLQTRLRYNPRAKVLFDPAESVLDSLSLRADLVAYISVLHHIPDYLAAVDGAIRMIEPGGAFVSYQDPLYYPRRSAWNLRADRAAYLCWRIAQGNPRRGMATQLRRWRRIHDPSEPSDMVEYHVVRNGVDEQALLARLSPAFEAVQVIDYWSTPSGVMQSLGRRFGATNTFAVVARGRHTDVRAEAAQ
jgi:hypothetical protein